MSNPPVSDRALRGALSLPALKAGASRAIGVKLYGKLHSRILPYFAHRSRSVGHNLFRA